MVRRGRWTGDAPGRSRAGRVFAGILGALALVVLTIPPPPAATPVAEGAEGVCKPGVVRRDGRFVPVAWRRGEGPSLAAAAGRSVLLRYLAHSSFLLRAPGGGTALTDPYAEPVLDPPPDVVTVSNLHETHSQFGPYAGKSAILLGATAEGRPRAVDRTFAGLRVAAFPQLSRMGSEGPAAFVVNTIFVFRAGGLCIAHFGNARFGPSPGQLRQLGRIHVLLLPIDGTFTVPHEVAAKIAARIGPNIVIPMHYFGPELPAAFAAALRREGIGRMVRSPSPQVALSLRRLPPPTTYMVLPNADAP